jgi:predicted dehydrogenase
MKKQTEFAFSRRAFLKRAAITTGAALAFPYIVPSSVFGKNAPSNRIVMGAIGLGGMGDGNLNSFLRRREVQFVAVCDVDSGHLHSAKNKVDKYYGNQNCTPYKDFRELVARDDIDAISMATPDHWHAVTAIAALQSGKDMYGEKPLTHDLREGRALCDTAKRYGRIWQTGSWQRSQGNFHYACELVRNGRIGKVHTVEVGLPGGHAGGGVGVKPVPAELDWNFWLGPAPARSYEGTAHYDWRWILDWGGGQMMDWIGHHADIAQWGLGTEYTGPVEFEGSGDFPKDGLYDAPTSYKFTGKYANGVTIIVANDSQQPKGMGVRWIGENGQWIWVSRSGLETNPQSLLKEKIASNEIQLYHSRDHHQNFLDCVRSRKPTITPCEVAHRSASIGHIGQIAMLTGRKIQWNPDTEEILNDPSASALLGRAYREPWSISST